MAEKSVITVLIIYLDLKRFQHITDSMDDLLTLPVFDLTILHRNDPVAFLLINTGNDITLTIPSKSCMDFISVIIGIFHSDDRTYFSVFFKKALHIALFSF